MRLEHDRFVHLDKSQIILVGKIVVFGMNDFFGNGTLYVRELLLYTREIILADANPNLGSQQAETKGDMSAPETFFT